MDEIGRSTVEDDDIDRKCKSLLEIGGELERQLVERRRRALEP